jgi:diaminopimelate epimerase
MKAAKMPIPVTKMHGTRNDFVILDLRTAHLDDVASFGNWICDRHAGVGADGLIVLEPSGQADVRMRVINADGSEAEMCGNGVRCAARWLDEAGEGDAIRFETLAGIVETRVIAREPEYWVRVTMGTPRIAVTPVPFIDNARYVDLGNPHVVLLRKSVEDLELTMIANRLQAMPLFPNGTNVHIAAVEGDALRVRHWERGVGLTMSCGTGAVACAAAAIDLGLLASPVDVFVPGGRLVVEWDRGSVAILTGPAVRVFDTEVRVEVGAAR